MAVTWTRKTDKYHAAVGFTCKPVATPISGGDKIRITFEIHFDHGDQNIPIITWLNAALNGTLDVIAGKQVHPMFCKINSWTGFEVNAYHPVFFELFVPLTPPSSDRLPAGIVTLGNDWECMKIYNRDASIEQVLSAAFVPMMTAFYVHSWDAGDDEPDYMYIPRQMEGPWDWKQLPYASKQNNAKWHYDRYYDDRGTPTPFNTGHSLSDKLTRDYPFLHPFQVKPVLNCNAARDSGILFHTYADLPYVKVDNDDLYIQVPPIASFKGWEVHVFTEAQAVADYLTAIGMEVAIFAQVLFFSAVSNDLWPSDEGLPHADVIAENPSKYELDPRISLEMGRYWKLTFDVFFVYHPTMA